MRSSHQSLLHPEGNTAPDHLFHGAPSALPLQDSMHYPTQMAGDGPNITPSSAKLHTSYSEVRSKKQPAVQRPIETQSHSLSPMRGPQTHASPRKTQTPQPYVPDHTGMTDFAIYMAQRELVTSGLIKFDDKPDNYWGWKSTFTNAIYGLRPATKSLTFWRNVLSRQNRSEELELSMSVTLRLGSGWPGCVWRNAMVLLK